MSMVPEETVSAEGDGHHPHALAGTLGERNTINFLQQHIDGGDMVDC